MASVETLLAEALALHRAGSFEAAAPLYAQALSQAPDHPDALHLLGVVEQQRGRMAESERLIRRALNLKSDAHYAANLANALQAQGRPVEAEQACRLALSIQPALAMAQANLGVALHAQGRREEAVQALRAAIALDPARPEPQLSLGVILLELGQRSEAVAILQVLVAVQPDQPQFRFNLANAIAADQTPANLNEALGHYDRVIAQLPAFADAQANRAAVLRRLERYAEAEQAFQATLALNPNSPLVHYNLGLMLGELDRPEAALAAFDRAIALAPGLALAHSHRGNMLSALGRFQDALAAHGRALALAPNDGFLHHNLGLSFAHDALLDQALAAQTRAIELVPDYAPAYAALSSILSELEQPAAALEAARRALALAQEPDMGMAQAALAQALMADGDLAGAEPALLAALQRRTESSQSHLNLAVCRSRQGRLAEALQGFETAAALRPSSWEAHFNLGVTRLKLGDYAQGWPHFEHRLRAPERRRADARYVQPLWMGEDLTGKSILLHGEQGLGDILMCARFIPQVAALGARVIVEAPPALHRLIARQPGVAEIIDQSAPHPPADFRAPLFSLPDRLSVTLDALPGPIPYFDVDPALTAHWRAELDQRIAPSAPRVGIVWSGNVTSKVDRGRSIPLAAFAPLAAAIGAPLIALQKRYGLDEIEAAPAGLDLIQLGEAYEAGDMADTAAVIQSLDLVVACDTSVAHLAGALGAPVWLAINAVGDWRWLTERADSPWYPSVRLYRQPTVGDWGAVFEAMARDWDTFINTRP